MGLEPVLEGVESGAQPCVLLQENINSEFIHIMLDIISKVQLFEVILQILNFIVCSRSVMLLLLANSEFAQLRFLLAAHTCVFAHRH